jgi:hypothetical protein
MIHILAKVKSQKVKGQSTPLSLLKTPCLLPMPHQDLGLPGSVMMTTTAWAVPTCTASWQDTDLLPLYLIPKAM